VHLTCCCYYCSWCMVTPTPFIFVPSFWSSYEYCLCTSIEWPLVCFHPLHSCPSCHTSTLKHSSIVLQLPTELSFAHLFKLSGDTLLLSGYCAFSPMPIPDPFDMAPVCSISPQDPFPLVQAIWSGTALAISNGSYMPNCYLGLAAAAWLLANPLAQKSLLFYRVTPVLSSSSQVNAYHAKLYGLYSLLVALEQFCLLHHIAEGGVLISCEYQGCDLSGSSFSWICPLQYTSCQLTLCNYSFTSTFYFMALLDICTRTPRCFG